MATKVTTQVDGLRELEKALRDIPAELVGGGTLGKNPLRKGVQRTVKNLLLPAIKSMAPVHTGTLRDNIAMQITNVKSRNAALKGGNSFEAYVVGVKDTYNTEAHKDNNGPWGKHKGKEGTPLGSYAYLVEGWKGRPGPGGSTPKKFMRKGFYQKQAAMFTNFKTEMGQELERIRKKFLRASPKK